MFFFVSNMGGSNRSLSEKLKQWPISGNDAESIKLIMDPEFWKTGSDAPAAGTAVVEGKSAIRIKVDGSNAKTIHERAPEEPSPIEQLYEALQQNTEIDECWIGYRHRREEGLDPSHRPTVIAMAPSHEEAFPMMLRLAGLDDKEAKVLGLTYAEMDDIHEFCKRLQEACGDTFELVSYDQAA